MDEDIGFAHTLNYIDKYTYFTREHLEDCCRTKDWLIEELIKQIEELKKQLPQDE